MKANAVEVEKGATETVPWVTEVLVGVAFSGIVQLCGRMQKVTGEDVFVARATTSHGLQEEKFVVAMQEPDPTQVVVLKMLTLTPEVLLSPVTYAPSKREIAMIGTTTKARTFLLTWNK